MKMRTLTAILLFGIAVAPLAARADDQQAQQACMNDAFAVCGQFIPDRGRVASCLYTNMSRVSLPCRQVLAQHDRHRVGQAKLTSTH